MSIQDSPYAKKDVSADEAKKNLDFLANLTADDGALLAHIGRQLLTARVQHSQFATTFADACRIVESEFLEFKSKAMVDRIDDAHVEAKHCIVTFARLINFEYRA